MRKGLARGFVALVFAATAVVCAGNILGPETFWLTAQAQYMPYYLYLAPAVVAVAASLRVGWGWRVVAAATLVLVLTRVMGLEVNSGEPGSPRIRIATYNIKDYIGASRPDGKLLVLLEIREHAPDVVVLQDAWSWVEADNMKPGTVAPLIGLEHVHAHAEFIVASRYPLGECVGRTPPQTDPTRNYLRCTIRAPGGAFDLLTTHFESPREGLNAVRHDPLDAISEMRENVALRMAQADALSLDLVQGRPRPLVVAGDLNAPEDSLVVRMLLQTGLRDAFSSAGKGYGYTYGHHALGLGISFLRIDHILVSSGIGVIDCFAGGKEASQHRPVIADLFLRPG